MRVGRGEGRGGAVHTCFGTQVRARGLGGGWGGGHARVQPLAAPHTHAHARVDAVQVAFRGTEIEFYEFDESGVVVARSRQALQV